MTNFQKQLSEKAEQVNTVLRQMLAEYGQSYGRVEQAMRYVLCGEGKRIRGALVLWCCQAVSGQENRCAQIASAAIELVHAYSLVHDDLPAMDDDDIRRGKPTCHKAFDEATAILTGDALLTIAFEVLAGEIGQPQIAIELIRQLSRTCGAAGMIAGQAADLHAERLEADEKLLEYIHTNKTAKMFQCAASMGGVCGGANKEQTKALADFGLKIGLGFQIADDILDVIATSEQLGKTAGKDKKAGKMTYPALFGLAKSRQLAEQLAGEAIAALKIFDDKAEILKELTSTLLQRTS